MKTASEKLYDGKKRKVFFAKKDRDLWVRLNAERMRYSYNKTNNCDEQDLGDIDTPHTYIWISNNQLIYDEYMEDQPRFSLEELAAMSHKDLFRLAEERLKETIERQFDETFDNGDGFIVFGGDEDFE